MTVGALVRAHALSRGREPAFITARTTTSWAGYDNAADRVAALLVSSGVEPGQHVAVVMPDGADVHAAFVGAERLGAVVVGIGFRAGNREVAHLVAKTGASVIVTDESRRAEMAGMSGVAQVIVLPGDLDALEPSSMPPSVGRGLGLGLDDMFLVNSTSGTTGMPKCVMHAQRRWFTFHRWAVEAGRLGDDEIVFSAIPAPFGFGLWTAHFTPVILGCATVLMDRYDASGALDLIEEHRVSVLACVSTQFIMMLNEQRSRPRDVSSLRCMFTGGEAIPYELAAEFEDRFGTTVLQFYGSNETGALSRTTMSDSRQRRLRTAGRAGGDGGPPLRHGWERRDGAGPSRHPRMPGTGHLSGLLRRRGGQPPAHDPGRLDVVG